MLNIAHTSYLQTSVSIFMKQLLPIAQLSQLITLPIDETLALLEKHNEGESGLKHVIKKLHQSDLKLLPAGNMDNLFLSVLLRDAQTIIRSLSGANRDFMLYWLRRFEMQNIKTIIRGKSLHYHNEQITQELTTLDYFSVLSLDDLLNTDDILDILVYLEKTPFASMVAYSLKNYDQHKDIFSIETSIHHHYFIGLVKRLNTLKHDEQKHIRPLLGKMIDQNNIICLLRYRLKYNLSASHSYFLLNPGGKVLHSQELIKLSQIEKLDQLENLLPKSLSARIDDFSSLHLIELSLERDIMSYAYQLLKQTQFFMAQAFIYLIIREKQLSQVHAILKGKLLQLSNKEVAYAVGIVK